MARKKATQKAPAPQPVVQKQINLSVDPGFAIRIFKAMQRQDPTGAYDGQNIQDLGNQINRGISGLENKK